MAKATVTTNDRRAYGVHTWLRIAFIGAALGVISLPLTWLLGTYVIDPLVCRGNALEMCGRSGEVAGNVAIVIVSVVSVALLIRQYVYRSVGIAIAVAGSFWGITALLEGLGWFETAAWAAGLYVFAYLLFANILRIRSLFVAVAIALVAVLLIRWVAFL